MSTQPDLRCYHHPDREATGQCDRCGDYLCGECVQELEKEYVCRKCHKEAVTPRLGRTGKVACVLNMVGIVFLFLVGLLSSTMHDRTVLLPTAGFLAALILSLVSFSADKPSAKWLRIGVMLYSLGMLIPLFFIGILGIEGPSLDVRFGGETNLPVVALLCLVLSFVSVIIAAWAAFRGVRPHWAFIVTILPGLFVLVMFGLDVARIMK